MKKTVLTTTVFLLAATSYGQLRVTSNGQVHIGVSQTSGQKSAVNGGISTGNPDTASNKENPDTTAALYVAGAGDLQSGGRIAFGQRGDVSVAESSYKIRNIDAGGVLGLVGKGGFIIQSNKKNIITYTLLPSSTSEKPVEFSVPIQTTRVLTVSDERSKTDIEPLGEVGPLLSSLSPVSYRLIEDNEASGGEGTEPSAAPQKSAQQDGGGACQYGFLAQEVREIFPDLVYEDEEGSLSIDYTGFIPVLVDAVKSLQQTVAQQAIMIAELQGQDAQDAENGSEASMSQNRPNPFRVATEIACVIPESVASAFICVYDLNGNQKLRKDISARGETTVSIEGNTLNAGMYIYTLVADGEEVDSKRMILTD